jgi:putative DNA primase/helicase
MTAGDAELIRFFQRWSGYSLTGDISEQSFLFGHGVGANGKGT